MSLIMRIAGNEVVIQKYANLVILCIAILLLFKLANVISNNMVLSFVVCVFSCLNPSLLQFGTTMMSEVLFFTLSMATLLLFIRWLQQSHWGWLIGVIVLMTATYYVRSLGLALVAGVLGALLFSKSWKALIISSAGFLVMALPWQIRNSSGSSYINQLMLKNPYQKQLGYMEGSDWLVRIWENLQRYITREIPDGFFRFIDKTDFSVPGFSDWLVGLLLLGLVGYGLYKTPKYRKVMLLYILATAGILLLWPQAWFGVRFVLPLIPVLMLYGLLGIYHGLVEVNKKFRKKKVLSPWLMLIFLLFAGLLYPNQLKKLRAQSTLPISKNYQHYYTMAEWVKENTLKESVVVCRKTEPLLRLC